MQKHAKITNIGSSFHALERKKLQNYMVQYGVTFLKMALKLICLLYRIQEKEQFSTISAHFCNLDWTKNHFHAQN